MITTFALSKSLPTNLSALIRPADTTIAVPCWSSWNTGMSSSSFNLLSISKHLGADISSRLIPPNTGAIRFTVSTISSTSFVSRQIGNASTPPNSLNRIAFPSITGIAASGPISPSPRTAVPSETTATILPLHVYLYTSALLSRIFLHGSATPGVYAVLRSSLSLIFTFEMTSTFPLFSSCIFKLRLL